MCIHDFDPTYMDSDLKKLPPELIQKAYEYLDYQYRKQDAINHIFWYEGLDSQSDSIDDLSSDGKKLLEHVEDIVDTFYNRFNANVCENDQFDFIIEDFIRSFKSSKPEKRV